VREGVEEQSLQPWRNDEWISRGEAFGERCEQGVNLFAQSSRVEQPLLLSVFVVRGGQQLARFSVPDEIRVPAPLEEGTVVGQVVAPPLGVCSPRDCIHQVKGVMTANQMRCRVAFG
jgi:hypothetical protein